MLQYRIKSITSKSDELFSLLLHQPKFYDPFDTHYKNFSSYLLHKTFLFHLIKHYLTKKYAMKNTRQKICTTIRDLKLYRVDLLSVRAQKIKSTQDQFYTYTYLGERYTYLVNYLCLIFYLY